MSAFYLEAFYILFGNVVNQSISELGKKRICGLMKRFKVIK